MSILGIMTLWTWGITPLWVNIVGTILLSARFIAKGVVALCKIADAADKD